MCFSAEVSFTAAAVLGVIGAGLMKMRKPPRLRYLSMIPFFFALQQASEGVLWLLLPHDPHSTLSLFFQHTFLFFAFIVWPIWMPFSLFKAETVGWRKTAMVLPLLGGVGFAALVVSLLYHSEAVVKIMSNSVSYDLQETIPFNLWHLKIAYAVIVLTPIFLSSLKWIKGFGALLIASWIATAYFYTATFTSVWCFFAALLSIYLVIVVKNNQQPYTETSRPTNKS